MDEFRRRPINRVPQPAPVPTPEAPRQGVGMTSQPQLQPQPQQPPFQPQPIVEPAPLPPSKVKKPRKRRPLLWIIISVVVVLVAVVVGVVVWYNVQLSPVNSHDTAKKVVAIKSGTLPAAIADQLKSEGVIRDSTAFLWYARTKGVQNGLQAGTYRLSPSESTPDIIEHLSKGKVDTFRVTFLPGATLMQNKKALEEVGYTKEEIDTAFAKTYTSSLFAGKPATADLEGYIYGDTYEFTTDASVEDVLNRVFEEFSTVVQENNLVDRFKAQGLTLYQGITLASIVQREASPKGDDMPQISQVFYKRLALNMPLGSDVTYQYIADKTGQPRDPNLDSPYNTRKYPGLPPGPISAPGKKALIAAANPANTDYLYFLSGDDNVTYFARTLDEHNANVRNHCQEKCQIL